MLYANCLHDKPSWEKRWLIWAEWCDWCQQKLNLLHNFQSRPPPPSISIQHKGRLKVWRTDRHTHTLSHHNFFLLLCVNYTVFPEMTTVSPSGPKNFPPFMKSKSSLPRSKWLAMDPIPSQMSPIYISSPMPSLILVLSCNLCLSIQFGCFHSDSKPKFCTYLMPLPCYMSCPYSH